VAGEEEEVLRRQIARYRARCSGMDDLVAVFRQGFMALYPDGASYGAAQHGDRDREKGQDKDRARRSGASRGGWVEREITNIKHSYEEEMKLLEAETTELRGKLRQSDKYISELRRRFEDNMKAMYRPAGRGQVRNPSPSILPRRHVTQPQIRLFRV
jgi:hypothetical protein